MSSRRSLVVPLAAAALAAGLAGCASSPTASAPAGATTAAGGGGQVIPVAASINTWGSILQQLGGSHVKETSLISNPNTDPHDYEPTPADSRVIAGSKLFVENGIGYDPWAQQSVAANPDPDRVDLDVGQVVGIPDGGNPHRWYSPPDVEKVADAITADLKRLDPADSAYYDTQRQTFETSGLATYHQLINDIRTTYSGTRIGASESIVTPLAEGLGLDLITPAAFLDDINDGTDPSAADKSTIDDQITRKQIKVYVYNTQNSTPDVAAQVDEARKAGIPVVQVTETLSPANASFEDWQSAQLRSLQTALAQSARS
ncbi:metal ABC transporter solute-binding protein, Zn/Mn family [Pseudonocardia xinjiangensis]|uniref:Zinc ABC transporter solute-binding protein n=1 Tax=Pseudonocardia xinjiangensis TaxID=75289 RepID=A0ABX1RHY0_9PSEU|nr:zinc ABC transporter substrate-binding protein [Pseudonocardia xinjiangensis]NMH78848.1 zinc ABC transporter solute-binding protein [Pseudonocardia xinjiangensis]